MTLLELEKELKDNLILDHSLLLKLIEYRPSLLDDLADLYGEEPNKLVKDIRLGKGFPTWGDYKHIYNL